MENENRSELNTSGGYDNSDVLGADDKQDNPETQDVGSEIVSNVSTGSNEVVDVGVEKRVNTTESLNKTVGRAKVTTNQTKVDPFGSGANFQMPHNPDSRLGQVKFPYLRSIGDIRNTPPRHCYVRGILGHAGGSIKMAIKQGKNTQGSNQSTKKRTRDNTSRKDS